MPEPFVVAPGRGPTPLERRRRAAHRARLGRPDRQLRDLPPGRPGGSGPPPHSHPWDEAFYVINGEIAFGIDGSERRHAGHARPSAGRDDALVPLRHGRRRDDLDDVARRRIAHVRGLRSRDLAGPAGPRQARRRRSTARSGGTRCHELIASVESGIGAGRDRRYFSQHRQDARKGSPKALLYLS